MGQTGLENISVSSQFLFRVFRSCQEMGARRPVLLSALNLADPHLRDPHLRDPQARFDSETIAVLCQATAQELGQQNIFPDVGQKMVPAGFSDIGYAATFGETVGDVLRTAIAALDFGVDKPMLRWEETASTCRLTWDSNSNASSELIFLIFSILLQTSNAIGNDAMSLVKAAYFTDKAPRCPESFLPEESHPLTVPCFFNQPQTYLELNRNVVNLPNPRGNSVAARAGQEQWKRLRLEASEPVSLTSLSYNYLFHLLDKSGLSLDAAAETFGMAERTLRRKLVAEGASFRQILEQVRRDTCQLYFLEGNRSLSEIAMKLGYSELSAFTRAYTAWYGRSPSRDMAAHIALAA